MHAPVPSDSAIPSVTLLGPGFLSRRNLALGWGLSWRVGLINGATSAALRIGLAVARGGIGFDPIDRLLLVSTTSLAGVLATDWAARRIAQTRYRLAIGHFVGFAVLWREALASVAWGSITGIIAGGGLAVIQLRAAEAARAQIAALWIATLTPVVVIMGLGGVGWAAHHVFRRESQRQASPEPAAAPIRQTQADIRTDSAVE